jgi:hypothetical protein
VTASFGSRSGSSTADLLFPLIFSPTILSITPDSGPLSGGTTVDIAGFNFVSGATVTFDGLSATAVVVTPTHIFCDTPAHAVGAVNVVVTNPDLQTSTLVNGFTYTALLVILGTNIACSSPDGAVWTTRTIPAGGYIAVAWNGFVYAAVGTNVVATSPDGVTWTAQTIPAGTYNGIAWNGTVFCAVGTSVAATSPDGVTWTPVPSPPLSTVNAIAWNGSTFVTVDSAGQPWQSVDGVNWTNFETGSLGSALSLAARPNGLLLAIATNRFTSPDGTAWTNRGFTAGSAVSFNKSIAANNTLFVITGNTNLIATTVDGVAVNFPAAPVANRKFAFWTGSLFVTGGAVLVCTSIDGVSWIQQGNLPAAGFVVGAAPITLPHA